VIAALVAFVLPATIGFIWGGWVSAWVLSSCWSYAGSRSSALYLCINSLYYLEPVRIRPNAAPRFVVDGAGYLWRGLP
jgi:hypothetical protein